MTTKSRTTIGTRIAMTLAAGAAVIGGWAAFSAAETADTAAQPTVQEQTTLILPGVPTIAPLVRAASEPAIVSAPLQNAAQPQLRSVSAPQAVAITQSSR